jgi:hypothetical protein
MTSTKMMTGILMITLFCLVPIFQLTHAEVFKWVDEKGTVHFTEDPATIPEKYIDKVKTRLIEEDVTSSEERAQERTIRQQPGENRVIRVEEPKVKQPNRPTHPVRSAFDPTQDRDYQEMLNTLSKSQYYQRDYYYPKSQRIMHRKGDLNPEAAKTAIDLKEKLDQLIRDPRYESSSEYKRQVKEYFKSHFQERDEYHPRGGTVMRQKGEIKTREQRTHAEPSVPIRDDNQVSHPAAGMKMPRDIYNPFTGHILKDRGNNHYFDPQTGQHWYPGFGGTYNPATGRYLIDKGDTFFDPIKGDTYKVRQ